MVLHADEPGMVGDLDDLRQLAVGRHAGEAQSGILELALVVDVDLVGGAGALGDARPPAVDLARPAAARQPRRIGAQAHGAAEIAAGRALLQHVAAHPLGHEPDHRVLARPELGRARAREPGQVARRLDHRHLHAEADAEKRHAPLAREARRLDLALGAALAEAAGDEDAVDAFDLDDRVLLLEDLGIERIELDAHIVGDAAMGERLGQRFVAVAEMGVLADDGDVDLALGAADARDDFAPARQIRRRRRDAEMGAHLAVEAFEVIGVGHLVDGVDVDRGDDAGFAHVAEQRDLLALAFGQRRVAAAQQDVGLNAEPNELLHRMLRRLGLDLARRGDPRHQGQMDEERALAAQLVAELADCLEEGQTLDIADGAADLAQNEILVAVEAGGDELLDGVGDVRDHLHGGAEILAAALAADHGRVDAAGTTRKRRGPRRIKESRRLADRAGAEPRPRPASGREIPATRASSPAISPMARWARSVLRARSARAPNSAPARRVRRTAPGRPAARAPSAARASRRPAAPA